MNQVDILCIEDNEDFRFFLSKAFESTTMRVNVHFIEAGLLAMASLKTGASPQVRPRMILLDLNLPDINGLEILKSLKESNDSRHIPVVILSSSDSPNDVSSALNLGANAYLTKPSGIKKIRSMVEDTCNFWLNHNYTSSIV